MCMAPRVALGALYVVARRVKACVVGRRRARVVAIIWNNIFADMVVLRIKFYEVCMMRMFLISAPWS
jgi:hypothetical protein